MRKLDQIYELISIIGNVSEPDEDYPDKQALLLSFLVGVCRLSFCFNFLWFLKLGSKFMQLFENRRFFPFSFLLEWKFFKLNFSFQSIENGYFVRYISLSSAKESHFCSERRICSPSVLKSLSRFFKLKNIIFFFPTKSGTVRLPCVKHCNTSSW